MGPQSVIKSLLSTCGSQGGAEFGGGIETASADADDSRIYTGLVKTQSRRDPSKYFIECAELADLYGSDVKLLDVEKPADVSVGDTVQFIIMEMTTGAPVAVNVSRVPVQRQLIAKQLPPRQPELTPSNG